MLKVKRAYDKAASDDGARYLIDRLWPRGVAKSSMKLEGWLKEVAPDDALRRWVHHYPERWNEFRKRYFAELVSKPETWKPLLQASRKSPVTLVYGARD